jgi:hypothetical protein
MNPENKNTYNFNNQDYDFVFRLYNGINDVFLTNTAWEDLYLEEDIFDWKIKGSVIIKSPYESFERESEESLSLTKGDKKNVIYKFRNDCRDTLFISIKPKIQNKDSDVQISDSVWRLEIEAVVYDVEELDNQNSINKYKKLYFWEKTYQLMREKNCYFSTATSGENSNKNNTDQLDNSERSLQTGVALRYLFSNDETFKINSNLTQNDETWDNGDDSARLFYSCKDGEKFIDALNYLTHYHISTKDNGYMPCILKFERAEKSLQPKQFSLKPISEYFEKAGNEAGKPPKEYQTEHFFIYGHGGQTKESVSIMKSPIDEKSQKIEFKGDDFSTIRNYKIVDMSGLYYSENLCNYRTTSFNKIDGQFQIENILAGEEDDGFKQFYRDVVSKNIVTKNKNDRLPITPFIQSNYNTKILSSVRTSPQARLAESRNAMINHYLFSNLTICFSVKGSTHRQTGRFFAVSKNTDNKSEFDAKLEGQYFLTNIIHHFSNSAKSYTTELVGVKTQTYKETTLFESNDNLIINSSNSVSIPEGLG